MQKRKSYKFLAMIVVLTSSRLSYSLDNNLEKKYYETNVDSPIVRAQVRFWKKIFYSFPSSTTILHDANHPDHIIDILDFERFAEKGGIARLSRSNQTKIVDKYLDRYRVALKRFHQYGRSAIKMGAIEKRVYSVYFKHPHLLSKLYKGQIEIRSQAGLRDSMDQAIKTAQRYLPLMEKIFTQEGVPINFTRIAFVESMFNLNARSKVGASGVWQFMKATGKQYLIINSFIDERNSPLKATRAAARLLRDNYNTLESWPLAITAYNHGVNGMRRAIKDLGTKSIGSIIEDYQSPSFGFASRNFYSEYIAVSEIYQKILRQQGIKSRSTAHDVVSIKIDRKISTNQLLKLTNLNRQTFEKYNGCLKSSAYSYYRNYSLPKNYEIFVPRSIAQRISRSLNPKSRKKYAIR